MKREDVTKIFEGATEEQINQLLNINSADIGNAKKKLETERDSYKDQLATAQNALKEFEGVDVKDLNGKIEKLTSDLKAKDTEYQQKIADMEFDSTLDAVIRNSKARNTKAVRALLDIEKLKGSKNQADDIKSALEALGKSDSYLFGSGEPVLNPVTNTNPNAQSTKPGSAPDLSAMRAAMGLPAEKK